VGLLLDLAFLSAGVRTVAASVESTGALTAYRAAVARSPSAVVDLLVAVVASFAAEPSDSVETVAVGAAVTSAVVGTSVVGSCAAAIVDPVVAATSDS